MPKMIIANRLSDGRVVFAAADGWVEAIESGRQFDADADAALTARLDDPFIIDPNLIEVIKDDQQLRPAAIREAIRAAGPTIEVEVGTQSTAE